jgi:DNA-directed RNA polymerase subunit beta'
MTSLTKGQLLSEEEFYDAQDEFGDDAFEASIGAEAIKKILGDIDLETERGIIRTELAETGL